MASAFRTVEVETLGEKHVGRFRLEGDTITTYYRGGARAAPLGGSSPDVIAKSLLLELVEEWRRILAERERLGRCSFDDWLAMDDDQRIAAQRTWNPYIGHNIHVPREAGRRLLAESPLPIVRVHVGIYHGGEYILNPELGPRHMRNAPAWLSQTFLGFRVGYCEHNPRIEWPADDDDD
jgi:hypothetical protein